MSKQTDDGVNTAEPTKSSSINQIREIILGEQISFWENNFKSLEKKLADLDRKISSVQDAVNNENSNLGDELNKLKKELSSKITKLQNEFTKKTDELDGSQVDKDSIGEVFIQWGQQVKTKMK